MSDTDGILDAFGEASEECDSLIGREQIAQIHALQAEINSLRSQISEKDSYISLLESNNSALEESFQSIISKLADEVPADEENRLASLQNFSDLPDYASKIQRLFDYMHTYKENTPNKRLCSYLQGHVEFLNRLALSPELQSLFLVSEHSGETFLSETSRRLIVEQAARTSKYLQQFSKETPSPSEAGDISKILDLNVDIGRREEMLSKAIGESDVSLDEVKVLLMQEASITSALRRYAESLSIVEKKEEAPNKEEEEVVDLMKRALDESGTHENDIMALGRRIAEDMITVKSAAGVDETELCGYLDDLKKKNLDLAKKLAESRAKVKIQPTMPPVSRHNVSDGDWEEWARRLRSALLGKQDTPADAEDVRLSIEEAALTAVGGLPSHYRADVV